MNKDLIIELIKDGSLIPVEVFGVDECCQHGYKACESTGYGLMDRDSLHSPSMSDCNRAAQWLMRPSDELMTNLEVMIAWDKTLRNQP